MEIRVPNPSEFLRCLDPVFGLSRSVAPIIGTELLMPDLIAGTFPPVDDEDLGRAVGGAGGVSGADPTALKFNLNPVRGLGFNASRLSGIDIDNNDGSTLISFFPD